MYFQRNAQPRELVRIQRPFVRLPSQPGFLLRPNTSRILYNHQARRLHPREYLDSIKIPKQRETGYSGISNSEPKTDISRKVANDPAETRYHFPSLCSQATYLVNPG